MGQNGAILAKREDRVVLVANRWDRVVLYLLKERTEWC